ncbi:MAG: ABC transporter substrate-binding protein [Burkholderiales bacterium]|nr:MAG: ABC transporter substrate-binding protein [Burkholderiales bacterium]
MTITLKGISSMATRQLLARLVEVYEQQSGSRIQIESVGGVDAAKRVKSGEAFDVVILASDAIDKLIADGHLLAGSRVDIVQSPVAIAIKSGAARAMITPANSLKASLFAAKSISYSTGPSGVYLVGLFEKMGIAELLKAKTVVPPPGVPVGSLVAKGEAELGFQQLSELINVDGIEVLGTLPEDIAYITTFSAGIPIHASSPAAVEQFLAFLNSAQAIPIKESQGMTPAN